MHVFLMVWIGFILLGLPRLVLPAEAALGVDSIRPGTEAHNVCKILHAARCGS